MAAAVSTPATCLQAELPLIPLVSGSTPRHLTERHCTSAAYAGTTPRTPPAARAVPVAPATPAPPAAEDTSRMCIACLERPRTHAFQPCGKSLWPVCSRCFACRPDRERAGAELVPTRSRRNPRAGHKIMCEECAEKTLQTSQRKQCPYCRTPVSALAHWQQQAAGCMQLVQPGC